MGKTVVQFIKFSFVFLIAFLYTACTDPAIFKEYQTIDNETWAITHKIKFEFEIPESESYDVLLCIRHTTDYEMANLWCFIQLSDTTHFIRKDTVNIQIAEPDGKWLGTGHSIKTVEYPLVLPDSIFKPGKYSFEIEQGMRSKSLNGIKNIGLIIRPKAQ